MATAFTHALVGAAFAHAAPGGLRSGRLFAVAMLLAVLPDLDVIAFWFGIPYGDPLGHRAASHSLAFAAAAGLFAALVGFGALGRFSRRWWSIAVLLALATASHGLLDAATNAGLGVGFWIPFDDARYFWPWRPLATSPIGIAAFFQPRSLAILANEFVWVWLPVGSALALSTALARRRAA